MVLHTYIHHLHHLSDLRSVLNMSTTMTLLTYIHTYIHTYIPAQLAEGSRLSRNNGTLITQTRHTNAALEQVPAGVVSCVRPRRGSAPRATVMNVRPMGSVLSKSRSSCGRPETVLPMPALVRIRATLIAEGAEPRSACCLRLCQKCNLNQKTEKLVLLSIKYCRSTTSLR